MHTLTFVDVFNGNRIPVTGPSQALGFAQQTNPDGTRPWAVINPENPTGFALAPVGPPPPGGGVFSADTSAWTINNTMIGRYTIAQWFSTAVQLDPPAVALDEPVRVVVDGKGRLVDNEEDLQHALDNGGYVANDLANPTAAPPAEVYRLILPDPSGVVNTGANYPGCSRVNQAACDPFQFASVDDAVTYALSNGEVPVMVGSVGQVWDIIEGKQPVPPPLATPSQPGSGGSGLLLAGVAALAALLFGRRRS